MRKTGAKFEFKTERDNAMAESYRRIMSQSAGISIPQMLERLVKEPCARFWVSEERATVVVSSMLRGCAATGMSSVKKRMFGEIYRRVTALMAEFPGTPLVRLVRDVIGSPAPEFYISPRSAYNILCNMKGGRSNG